MEREAARPRAVVKSATAFRTISEVSDELEVPQHVLRFWETKFPQVRPLKRGGGRRYYRPEDVALLRKIQRLLYSEGYTIKGVQRLLKDQRQAGTEGDAETLVEDLLEAEFETAEAAPGDDAADLADGDDGVEDEDEAAATAPTPAIPAEPPAERARSMGAPPASVPASPHPASPHPIGAVPPVIAAEPRPIVTHHADGTETGDLPPWVRRELGALRAELIDIKGTLRKAIR